MRLSIHLLNDFHYHTGMKQMPVVVAVESDEPVEIAKKVDLNSVFLENEENDEASQGFTVCITGMYRDTIVVSPGAPYRINIDVLERILHYEEELIELLPGKYRLSIQITVFKKIQSEDFKAVCLSGEKTLVLNAPD